MKKLLLIGLFGLLMCGVSHAFSSSYWLCEDDTVPRYPVKCFKANGIDAAVIESCNMFVYLGSAQVYGTSARTNILDSVTYAGKKNYMLDTMLVNEIDGTGGVGWYTVVINAFYTGGGDTSTTNSFTFFKIGGTSAGQELITDIINDNFDAEVTAMNTDVITATAIADNALTANEIGASAIGASELADNAITSSKIQDNALAFAKFADGAIGTGKIGADAITATTIESDAIGSAELAADAIGASEIAADAIGASEIAANALTTAELATGSISADEVADDAIDAGAIAANALTTAEIATGAISSDEVADNAIDAGAIAADAIASSELATTAVTEVVTAVYAADTATYNGTVGSYGQILSDASYMQGEASGLTVDAIWGAEIDSYFTAGNVNKAGYLLAMQDTANTFWYDVTSDSALWDTLLVDTRFKRMISNWSAVSAGADSIAICSMMVRHDFLQGADSVRIANWPWDNDNIARASRDVDDIASFDGANEVIIGNINNDVITTEVFKNGALTPAKFDTSFYRVAADTLLRRTVTSPSGPIPPTSIAAYIPNISAYVDGDGVSGLDARVLEIQEDIGDPSNDSIPTRVAWATDDSLGNLTIEDIGEITVVVDTPSFFAQMKAEGFVRKVGVSNDSIYAALNAGVTSSGIESLLVYVGKDGVSTPSVSLHMKLGPYSGASTVHDDFDSVTAAIAAIAAGSGIDGYPVSIYVKSATRYLHGADVYLVPSGGGSRLHAKTNAAGLSSFMATTGTWYIYIYNTFCDQDAAYDSLIMASAAITDTITLTCEEASLYNTTQIFGAVTDFDASLLKKVKVSAKLISTQANVKITSTNTKISPFERTVAVDAYGHWQIPVFANSILSDTLSKYQITISGASGTIHKSLITVPDQGIYELP